MVFYQAIEDKLRIVYSKIIRKLRFIQLRDIDGKTLVVTKDYELIRECLQKFQAKIQPTEFFPIDQKTVSLSYRKYSAAYFEEIILKYGVEERIA